MKTERITFEGHDGAALAARLDAPDRGARAYALFAHCFTCGKDIAAARRIAQALTDAGVAVLRFDFTGLGHSKGEFSNTTFSSNIEDLLRAADWLRRERSAPQLLIGHSLGGAAALAAAPELPEVTAVVSIAAPADPAHVLHNFGPDLETIRQDGAAEVALAGRPFTIKKAFIDDVEEAKLENALGRMKKALLVMHAPRDDTVGVENATQIFQAAKHPKSFVTLDDADHLITRDADARYAAGVIAAWAARYMTLAPEAHPAEGAGEGVVRSAETAPGPYTQDVHAGRHHLSADEPASVGGADLGPTPYQLVSAGLAACTAITLRLYAERKGLKLEHVAVDVTHDKVHAADCESCEMRQGRIDLFRRTISLTGDLDQATRARLLEIADKCPVHRTLEGQAAVETSLA